MPAVIYTHVLITTSLNVSNFTNDTHVAAQLVTLKYQISSTNKTDRHDIAEMLLKVAINTITPNS
jgi:hypothetical protein